MVLGAPTAFLEFLLLETARILDYSNLLMRIPASEFLENLEVVSTCDTGEWDQWC